MPNVKTTTAALTLAAVSPVASAAVTQFADATFDDGWSFESHTTPYLGGSEGGAVLIDRSWRQATGDYLRFRYYTPVESIIHGMAFWDQTTWNPSTDGAIASVDFGMLSLNLNDTGNITQASIFVKQGDRYFTSVGGQAGNEYVHYAETIQADHFVELDLGSDDYVQDSHPDFSGSEDLVFGLGMSWVFTLGTVGQNWTYGADNFFLRIHHRPVPAPGTLALLGLTATLSRRRRLPHLSSLVGVTVDTSDHECL